MIVSFFYLNDCEAAFCDLNIVHSRYIEMILVIKKYLYLEIKIIMDNMR